MIPKVIDWWDSISSFGIKKIFPSFYPPPYVNGRLKIRVFEVQNQSFPYCSFILFVDINSSKTAIKPNPE